MSTHLPCQFSCNLANGIQQVVCMISIHKISQRSIWTLTYQGGSNSMRVWVHQLWRLVTSSFHILLQMVWSIQSEQWAMINFKFSWRSLQRKQDWKGTTLHTAFSVEVHNIDSCLHLLVDIGPWQRSDGGAAGQLARRWAVKHPVPSTQLVNQWYPARWIHWLNTLLILFRHTKQAMEMLSILCRKVQTKASWVTTLQLPKSWQERWGRWLMLSHAQSRGL